MVMDESIQNTWQIQARVIMKGPLKEYKGGKLFKMDLEDDLHKDLPEGQRKCHQIEATCFKECVAKFMPILKQGKTYRMSNLSIYKANKKFTQIDHDFRLILNDDAVIKECTDEQLNTVAKSTGEAPDKEDVCDKCHGVENSRYNQMLATHKSFIKMEDILKYSQTLVSSGLLLNSGASSMPGNPLQL